MNMGRIYLRRAGGGPRCGSSRARCGGLRAPDARGARAADTIHLSD